MVYPPCTCPNSSTRGRGTGTVIVLCGNGGDASPINRNDDASMMVALIAHNNRRRVTSVSGYARGEMVHAIRLGVLLYGLWLLLSGYYLALLISLGLVSTALVTAIALRMDIVDHETYPVPIRLASVSYWGWLGWEIVKANIEVTRRILNPALPINPHVIRVKASQHSKLGLVTYANSITLTPGTVSIDVDGDTIEVHALSREAARDLESGEMDRRITAMEGRP